MSKKIMVHSVHNCPTTKKTEAYLNKKGIMYDSFTHDLHVFPYFIRYLYGAEVETSPFIVIKEGENVEIIGGHYSLLSYFGYDYRNKRLRFDVYSDT